MRSLSLTGIVAAAALALSGAALAAAPVAFDGGTPAEQGQVRAALAASTFDWSLLPQTITVHIGGYQGNAYSLPGEVFVDAGLLDQGTWSWGTVQHEFGHQVDFFLLDDADRAQLETALRGQDWCDEETGLAHAAYGCERFASELAWAYWQSPKNAMQPAYIKGESGGMPTAAFRTLLASMLGEPAPAAGATTVSAASAPNATPRAPHRAARPTH